MKLLLAPAIRSKKATDCSLNHI